MNHLFRIGLFFQPTLSPDAGVKPPINHYNLVQQEKLFDETERFLWERSHEIAEYDHRISSLKNKSNVMLYAIGFLIFLSAVTILFAGVLTSIDAASGDKYGVINDMQNFHRKAIADYSRALNLLGKLNSQDSAERSSANQSLNGFDLLYFPRDEKLLQSFIQSEQKQIEDIQTIINESVKSDLTSPHGYSDTKYLIASAFTRIGVVFIIVFLVQILMNLYKYNNRLIAFYAARRDALQISSRPKDNFTDLVKIMEPKIDFGKEPKHPLEEIVRETIAKLPHLNVGANAGTNGNSDHPSAQSRASGTKPGQRAGKRAPGRKNSRDGDEPA